LLLKSLTDEIIAKRLKYGGRGRGWQPHRPSPTSASGRPHTNQLCYPCFLDLIYEISSTTGVMLDPVYTIKSVKGMLNEMSVNTSRFKGQRVLYIHTGISYNY